MLHPPDTAGAASRHGCKSHVSPGHRRSTPSPLPGPVVGPRPSRLRAARWHPAAARRCRSAASPPMRWSRLSCSHAAHPAAPVSNTQRELPRLATVTSRPACGCGMRTQRVVSARVTRRRHVAATTDATAGVATPRRYPRRRPLSLPTQAAQALGNKRNSTHARPQPDCQPSPACPAQLLARPARPPAARQWRCNHPRSRLQRCAAAGRAGRRRAPLASPTPGWRCRRSPTLPPQTVPLQMRTAWQRLHRCAHQRLPTAGIVLVCSRGGGPGGHRVIRHKPASVGGLPRVQLPQACWPGSCAMLGTTRCSIRSRQGLGSMQQNRRRHWHAAGRSSGAGVVGDSWQNMPAGIPHISAAIGKTECLGSLGPGQRRLTATMKSCRWEAKPAKWLESWRALPSCGGSACRRRAPPSKPPKPATATITA